MRLVIVVLIIANLMYFALNQYLQERVTNKSASSSNSSDIVTHFPYVLNEAYQNNQCVFIGGFDNVEPLLQLEQRLFSLNINAKRFRQQVLLSYDYQVYVKPVPNKSLQVQATDMKLLGFSAYIIPSGDLKDNISLGTFINENLANNNQQQAKKVNLDAKIAKIPRRRFRFWLQLPFGVQKQVEVYSIEKLIENYNGAIYKVFSCNE